MIDAAAAPVPSRSRRHCTPHVLCRRISHARATRLHQLLQFGKTKSSTTEHNIMIIVAVPAARMMPRMRVVVVVIIAVEGTLYSIQGD